MRWLLSMWFVAGEIDCIDFCLNNLRNNQVDQIWICLYINAEKLDQLHVLITPIVSWKNELNFAFYYIHDLCDVISFDSLIRFSRMKNGNLFEVNRDNWAAIKIENDDRLTTSKQVLKITIKIVLIVRNTNVVLQKSANGFGKRVLPSGRYNYFNMQKYL